MSFHIAEVAPVAVPVLEAIPLLLALAGLIVALGMIRFVVAFIDFMVWMIRKTVGHIPFAGGAIEGLAKRGAQKLTNALGKAEQGLDHYIGWCFHNMAHLARMLVREVEGLAHDLWLIGAVIPGLVTRLGLHYLVRGIRNEIKAWLHLLRRIERLAHARLHTVERTIVHGVYPRIRAGEAALDRVIEWDIPRLRARERALARRVGRLGTRVRALEKPIATAAFAAAVATVLRRFGADWIRCSGLKKRGPMLCRFPLNLLEGLAGLALAFGVLIDPEDTARLAVNAVDFVEPLVARMLGATATMERDAEAALAGLLS